MSLSLGRGMKRPRRIMEVDDDPSILTPLVEDDEHHNLIVYKNDIFINQYLVIDIVGNGVYSQVFSCMDLKSKKKVAIKVVKSHPSYAKSAEIETKLLRLFSKIFDFNKTNLVKMLKTFTVGKHFCIVFELLGESLFSRLASTKFQGFEFFDVSSITRDILRSLKALGHSKIIHRDLKPENILTRIGRPSNIKLIDFGSATSEMLTIGGMERNFYVQSRYYRGPEVLLGLKYGCSVDIWSLGLITAELYLGKPLFNGVNQYDQLKKIISIIGMPSKRMMQRGLYIRRYFNEINHENKAKKWELKSEKEWSKLDPKCKLINVKRPMFYTGNNLKDIIMSKPMKLNLSKKDQELEKQRRFIILDFLNGILRIDPRERWSPEQCLSHPFITGKEFFGLGKFLPLRNKEYVVEKVHLLLIKELIMERRQFEKYSKLKKSKSTLMIEVNQKKLSHITREKFNNNLNTEDK